MRAKFKFKKIDGKMTLVWWEGDDEILQIPNTYKGQNVTVLGRKALSFSDFTHVTLPNYLEVIESDCFHYCSKLEDINFPDTLKVIEASAFSCCAKLTEVELPANVEKVSTYCFTGCLQLKKVVSHNKNIKLGASPFINCENIVYASANLIHGFTISHMVKFVLPFFSQWDSTDSLSKEQIIKLINKNSDLKYSLFSLDDIIKITFLLKLGLKINLNEIESYLETHINKQNIDITAKLLDYKNENFSKEFIDNYKEREELLEIGFELPTFTELKKNWVCSKKDGLIRISGYKGESKSATIPESLQDGTKIGAFIFSKLDAYAPLESLTIHTQVTTLDEKSFYKCQTLKEISLPDTIVSIGKNAFRGCSGLENIKLPDTLVNIEPLAFAECESLKEVTIPVNVETVGTRAFERCGKLEKVEFLGKLHTINSFTFKYCSSLTEVIFSDSLEYIHEEAFSCCETIKEITIPKNIKAIRSYAFINCFDLKKAVFLGPKFEIDNHAFDWNTEKVFVDDCNRSFIFEVSSRKVTLTEYRGDDEIVVVPDFYYDEPVRQIAEKVFYRNSKIREVVLPSTINFIANKAFYDCYNLHKVVLESDSMHIKDSAFGGNTFLESASLELISNLDLSTQFNLVRKLLVDWDNLTDEQKSKLSVIINRNAQLKHKLLQTDDINIYLILKEIVILILLEVDIYFEYHIENNNPDIVEILKSYRQEKFSTDKIETYDNNKLLLESGKCLPVIHEFRNDWEIQVYTNEIYIFGYNGKFSKQTIPVATECGKNITRIVYSRGKNRWQLDTLIIEAKITKIYENSFSNAKIRKLVLPESVTWIEENGFYSSYISQIVLSKNITNIDGKAFYKCYNLTKIELPECLNYIGESCFEYSINLEVVKFNDNLKRVYTKAFAHCPSLVKVVIPTSVEFLGDSVFADCTSLSCVEIKGNLSKINVSLFENCCNLTEIILPETVEVISYEAFKNCTSIEEITIPASVKIIEDRAFIGCQNLKNVRYLGDNPKLGKDVFLYTSKDDS